MNATGGYDGNSFLSSIECYSVSEDEWSEEGSMMCGRSGHAVAVTVEPSHEYVSHTHIIVLYVSSSHSNTTTWFLADRTNGHAIGTVVRLSSSVNE